MSSNERQGLHVESKNNKKNEKGLCRQQEETKSVPKEWPKKVLLLKMK